MKMMRRISFTAEHAIRIESETSVEVVVSGVVILTAEQRDVAVQHHGWEAFGAGPISDNGTDPPLYAVRKT